MNNFNNQNGYNQNDYPNMNNLFNNTRSFEQNLSTNKWKVQNLQDALSRYAPPNSCGCYHCIIDNIEYEYEVYTDMNGQKSYKVYKRVPCDGITSTNPELSDLLERIRKLEEIINGKSATNSSNGNE